MKVLKYKIYYDCEIQIGIRKVLYHHRRAVFTAGLVCSAWAYSLTVYRADKAVENGNFARDVGHSER